MPGALRVAGVFPTVGRYAVSGLQSLNGVRLAVDEINHAGGIHGRRLDLREYRTGSYFVDARHAATLAVDDGALAVVGANSSELSMAVAEETEARGVVQVSNVSTAQDLTWDPLSGRTRDFVFRVCSSDVVMGALLADYALENLGAHRAAVLYEVGREYSHKLARSFIDRFEETAGRPPREFFYLALETDFRPQLRLIADFAPDVVFVPGSFTDATLIAGQATALGLEATLLGGDGWSNPLLFRRGAPPGDAYFVELCSSSPEFERRYQAVFGRVTQGCRALLGYDAVQVVAAGLRALGPLPDEALASDLQETRLRLRDAVAAVRGRRRERHDPLRRARRPSAGCGPERGGARPGWPPGGPRARLAGGAVSRLVRAIRDLSLRGKVTLTLAVVFTGSVLVLLLALVPILGDQRQRLIEQDRRLLTTLRRNAERELIYDLLSENRESLAVHLGALAGQEGIVWARIEADGLDLGATADRGAIRRLLGEAARPFLGEPVLVLIVDREGRADLVGAGGRTLLPDQGVRRESARPAPETDDGADQFRETTWGGQQGARPRRDPLHPRPVLRPAAPALQPRPARTLGDVDPIALLRRRHADVRPRPAPAQPASLAHRADAGAAGARRDVAGGHRRPPGPPARPLPRRGGQHGGVVQPHGRRARGRAAGRSRATAATWRGWWRPGPPSCASPRPASSR